LADILADAIARDSRLELVTRTTSQTDLRDVLRGTMPDVLVTRGGARKEPHRGFDWVLFEHPWMRVVSIGGSGLETVQVTLMPTEEALGDISLETLMALIAEEGPAPRVHPRNGS
jgi:hypothetical protein